MLFLNCVKKETKTRRHLYNVKPYLFSDSRENDEEGDEDGGEGDVDENVAHILRHGGAVCEGVEGGASVTAERVEPTPQHPPLLTAAREKKTFNLTLNKQKGITQR
ncbi:hypothetical protein AVEN_86823-1 [Araneus ventricosus]|uniref:Uncharacterized protein n=1 Tax=Araneus ventricosus TaxID=182803 RepID=A0A4Y2CZQ2_ARAVE|nr:hypothetical protein AVEN_86823-1 [Araneus ventricosus]